MNTFFVASGLLAGAMLLPVAVYTADSDAEIFSPAAFLRGSVTTFEIKLDLAENSVSSLLHINVMTENMGLVVLSGAVSNQQVVDEVISIVRAVEGVNSVENYIMITTDK